LSLLCCAQLFSTIVNGLLRQFRPEAVVLVCGADCLAQDRLGGFNLTTEGVGKCVQVVLQSRVPTILLGGGGYHEISVARCWTHLTALACGVELPNHIPEHEETARYGPDFALHTRPLPGRENRNDAAYLSALTRRVKDFFARARFPFAGAPVAATATAAATAAVAAVPGATASAAAGSAALTSAATAAAGAPASAAGVDGAASAAAAEASVPVSLVAAPSPAALVLVAAPGSGAAEGAGAGSSAAAASSVGSMPPSALGDMSSPAAAAAMGHLPAAAAHAPGAGVLGDQVQQASKS
jgi:hypothetical protein